MTAEAGVTTNTENRVAQVRLNRPDQMNALDSAPKRLLICHCMPTPPRCYRQNRMSRNDWSAAPSRSRR